MAIGRRKKVQTALWVSTDELPRSPGHPFYARLNQVLSASGFDQFAEAYCARFYARVLGRPSLSPGRYFRLMLVGYFEGLDSERGMSWRASDSLAIRSFLELGLNENAPDHSTISRTRRLIDVETHREVFTWILERLAETGLLKGKTIGIDATTLEANAAMRSIVRRDTGETYQDFLTRLAKSSGIRTPSRQALVRLDRHRKKKGANKEWASPADSDARITKMKDGRTHLSHKTEQAVDMATGAIVAVTIAGADRGDTTTITKTLAEAQSQIEYIQNCTNACQGGLQEVVADKGYHSTAVLLKVEAEGIRPYISEPNRGKRKWKGDLKARRAVYANRRRNRGERGKLIAAPERRTRRAAIRPPLSDGTHETDSSARSREHPQAAPSSQRCAQSRTAHASGARNRNAARLAGPFPCPLVARSRPLAASEGYRCPVIDSPGADSLLRPITIVRFVRPRRSGFHHGLLDQYPI